MNNANRIFVASLLLGACGLSAAGWRVSPAITNTPALGEPTVSRPNADGTVDVSVEVESVTEMIGGKPMTSGVYDLRLFRDGQLVGSSIPVANIETYIAKAPPAVERDIEAIKHDPNKVLHTEEDGLWQQSNDLFKIAPPDLKKISDTKAIYTFHNIQVPRDGRKKEVEFSAYAFNSDRVKSDTARTKFPLPAMPPAPRGKAYIVSVGVNSPDLGGKWRLTYAAEDAHAMVAALSERLSTNYDVVPIELTSDDSKKNAARSNISAALKRLSGVQPSLADNEKLRAAVGDPVFSKITRSTPQDVVFLTFSSHGFADAAGNFYLLPSGAHMKIQSQKIPDLNSMISSDELSLWMRDLDASEKVMIIDACYAASSVEGAGFKPAPMGSRGLGQLAYDKQMRILAATRATTEERDDLRHGILTYALITEGLIGGKAVRKAHPDGGVTLSEWLEFGRDEVPVIFKDLKSGKIHEGLQSDKGLNPVTAGTPPELQFPALFDFRRDKSRDIELKK